MTDWPTIIVILVALGIVGALIAPRKGISPGEGFALGFMLSILGLAYLALKRDVPQRRIG